jgi:hypothetical protein
MKPEKSYIKDLSDDELHQAIDRVKHVMFKRIKVFIKYFHTFSFIFTFMHNAKH